MNVVYKIVTVANWRAAQEAGVFLGAGVDLSDRFIHFSTAAQVEETARRHYAGVTDLLLVAVDVAKLGPALKWEPSRGGELFPHLYGPLPMDAVMRADPLPPTADGQHDFAGLLE
jgi:uncharacterized protein (DUF952 family)